jgi:hypothetical protein
MNNLYVTEFLCCRIIWVPPPPFPCEMAPPPLYFYSLYCICMSTCLACLHLLAGEGAGGPKSYDSTETLVLYVNTILTLRLQQIFGRSYCYSVNKHLSRHFNREICMYRMSFWNINLPSVIFRIKTKFIFSRKKFILLTREYVG